MFRLQFDEFQIVSSSHDDSILIWDFLNCHPPSATAAAGAPAGVDGLQPAAIAGPAAVVAAAPLIALHPVEQPPHDSLIVNIAAVDPLDADADVSNLDADVSGDMSPDL